MEIALHNGEYQQLAEDLQQLVGNPVALYEKNLNLLACHPSAEGGGVLSDCHLKEALVAVDEEQAASALSLLTGCRQGFLMGPMPEISLPNGRVVAPALSGDDFLGYVHLLEEGRKLNDYDVRVAERAAVILALRVMRERAEAEVEQRLRGELLDDLLASDIETVDGAVKRSAHLGHDLKGAHLVLAVELDAAFASGQGDAMTRRERLLEQVKLGLDASGADAVTDVKEERVVSLVKCPDADKQAHGPHVVGRLLHDRLERKFFQARLHVGLGGVCQEPHEFRRSYEEALVCLRVARSQTGTTLVVYEDLGLVSLLFDSDHPERLTSFVEARLGALVRYDSEHRSELVQTSGRCSASPSARARTTPSGVSSWNPSGIGALPVSSWSAPMPTGDSPGRSPRCSLEPRGSAAECTSSGTCWRSCPKTPRAWCWRPRAWSSSNPTRNARASSFALWPIVWRGDCPGPPPSCLRQKRRSWLTWTFLAHMDFPREHWTKFSSTNPLERLNKEIARRTRVVGIFPTRASLIRLAGSLLAEQSDEWAFSRRYMSQGSLVSL